jgi:hypothetical protein
MSKERTEHVFRFVISGTELSGEEADHIASAVAQAGATAVAELPKLRGGARAAEDVLYATYFPREWLGLWLALLMDQQVKQQVRRIAKISGAPA